MNARVPQDVDLEDRLIFGLSPVRFGYVIISFLGGLSLWRVDVLAPWLRAVPCLLLLALGAVLAWGRWRGRPLDHWSVDLVVFVHRNYGLRRRPLRARRGVVVPLHALRSIAAQRA